VPDRRHIEVNVDRLAVSYGLELPVKARLRGGRLILEEFMWANPPKKERPIPESRNE
jgi:hypothetical protein